MNYIDLYGKLYEGFRGVQQPIVTKSPEEVSKGLPLVEDARDVTLSQYEPMTKDFITAHRIKDYRRKTFNLILLPDVDVLFDEFLKGCKYYEEQLRNESAYS